MTMPNTPNHPPAFVEVALGLNSTSLAEELLALKSVLRSAKHVLKKAEEAHLDAYIIEDLDKACSTICRAIEENEECQAARREAVAEWEKRAAQFKGYRAH